MDRRSRGLFAPTGWCFLLRLDNRTVDPVNGKATYLLHGLFVLPDPSSDHVHLMTKPAEVGGQLDDVDGCTAWEWDGNVGGDVADPPPSRCLAIGRIR